MAGEADRLILMIPRGKWLAVAGLVMAVAGTAMMMVTTLLHLSAAGFPGRALGIFAVLILASLGAFLLVLGVYRKGELTFNSLASLLVVLLVLVAVGFTLLGWVS